MIGQASPALCAGGIAVGEGPEEMDRVVSAIAPQMPPAKPRYLMGVGFPRDLVASVRGGIDLYGTRGLPFHVTSWKNRLRGLVRRIRED